MSGPIGSRCHGGSREARRAAARPALAGALVLAALLGVPPSPAAEEASPAPGAPRTAPRVEVLRHLVDLSKEEQFYLVLEPQASLITLMYRGVVARRYPVTSVEIGRKRILFVSQPLASGTPPPAFGAGRLEPPPRRERFTLSVDSQGQRQEGTTEPPLLPPTPEEAVPAPPRYSILFDGGMELDVVSDAAGGATGPGGWLPGLLARWDEFLSALGIGEAPRMRLRLRMPREEAASLYRGLPADFGLVIVP